MPRDWESTGIDTVHLSYKEGPDLGVSDLILGLGDLFDEIGLTGDFRQRNRGRNGYEHGITFLCGVEVDWTHADGEGPNRASISCQFKGKFFETFGALETALFGLTMAELGEARASRLDVQITSTQCPEAPELIRLFREGKLKVVRKKTFEPKGQELEGGRYPKGATLTHGSRQSSVFIRQYDKHKESGEGPPRLRTENEFKGDLAAQLWQEFVEGWQQAALGTAQDLASEVKLSQQFVRNYMPLRDVSQWAPDARPKSWASEAPEPEWWAALFSEQAVAVRRKKAISRSLRDGIGHNRRQGGGRFLQDLILTEVHYLNQGYEPSVASEAALCTVRDRMAMHASDARLQELLQETPAKDHEAIKYRWAWYGKNGADQEDRDRDESGSYPPM